MWVYHLQFPKEKMKIKPTKKISFWQLVELCCTFFVSSYQTSEHHEQLFLLTFCRPLNIFQYHHYGVQKYSGANQSINHTLIHSFIHSFIHFSFLSKVIVSVQIKGTEPDLSSSRTLSWCRFWRICVTSSRNVPPISGILTRCSVSSCRVGATNMRNFMIVATSVKTSSLIRVSFFQGLQYFGSLFKNSLSHTPLE